ncbi:diguanylate cyclase [Pelagibius sp. Alg239-R121]|uniref:diguanylate cyclase n=1 Tax=Pelagibius sp. Alg239-R121 TaxID=2993448 RepID=UPI0024A7414F|nr:diguanylate cyclase [Pelagibius sp. Alg239-R121]
MRKIAIIDDVLPNALLLKGYTRRLEDVEAFTFTDPVEALSWCAEHIPDLVMLDYLMPEMDGTEFLQHFRKIEGLIDIPVVVITAAEQKEALYSALEAGANDFLRKPVDDLELIARANNMLQLRARQLELAEANERLLVLATTDSLTGLANRRHFLDKLREEIARCQRYGRPFSVAMVDADHFKSVNDTYGHEVGDRVLKRLSNLMSGEVRDVDCVGRLGGEEFAILLPETEVTGAKIFCERLLTAIRETEVDTDEDVLRFTVSMGLTEVCKGEEKTDVILNRADEALYEAKEGGRDRVVIHEQSSDKIENIA